MIPLIEGLLHSRIVFYLLGVLIVVLILFTTAARSPRRQCPRCQAVNRPNARYCAFCGQKLVKS